MVCLGNSISLGEKTLRTVGLKYGAIRVFESVSGCHFICTSRSRVHRLSTPTLWGYLPALNVGEIYLCVWTKNTLTPRLASSSKPVEYQISAKDSSFLSQFEVQ